MAADGQVDISLKLTADTKGGKEAEQALDNVGKKSKSAFAKMGEGVAHAKVAMGRLRSAILMVSSIGFLKGSFDAIVGIFDKFTERERKAKEEAQALAAAEKDAADTARIEKLAAAYKKLSTEIADAAKARERANELEDMQRTAADKLEDDTAELKMREEIAALDTEDPLYDKKKEQISARYETEKLRRSVARQQRDAGIAEERTWAERDATVEESTEKQFSLMSDREELERLKGERDKKIKESKSLNKEDNHTFLQRFKENLAAVFTLDPTRFNKATSEAGDEKRKKAAEDARALDEQVKAKRAEIKAKEKEVADLNKTAEHLAKKAGIQGNIAIDAGVAVKSAAVSSATTTKAADKALATEQAKIADASAAQRALAAQKADIKARIASEQAKKDAAGMAVYQAQGDLDMANAGGDRKSRISATAALTEAQNAAQNVNHAADSAINALAKTLKSVETRLKAAKSFLESQSKQQRNAWSESPAGA